MAYRHAAITVVRESERKFLGNWREKRSEDGGRTDCREEQLQADEQREKSVRNDQG